MAVGDQALAAGLSLVPDTGEEGRLRWGGREINRTRDYIAEVIAGIPVSNVQYQYMSGISAGTDPPSGGNDGDIYFQIVGS